MGTKQTITDQEFVERFFQSAEQSTGTMPAIRVTEAGATGEHVLDRDTAEAIEMEALFDALNQSKTLVGQAVLYRSLYRPLDSAPAILEKQEALRELKANPALAAQLSEFIQGAAENERAFYQLLFSRFNGVFGGAGNAKDVDGFGYGIFKSGTAFMLGLAKRAREFAIPGSGYLRSLIERLVRFDETGDFSLMRGPVYVTEGGIRTRAEHKWFVPAIIFRPRLFKPLLFLLLIAGVILFRLFSPVVLPQIAQTVMPVLVLFVFPLLFLYVPIVGGFDRDSCIYPLRDRFKASPEVKAVLETLGRLDELLSYHLYAEAFRGPVTLPTVLCEDVHRMRLKAVRNPILGKDNGTYVPNDILLQEVKLTFITGPNSGGKTALCKTIAQTQVLAQAGCYVPATSAEMVVADFIFYQIAETGTLHNTEGRFGTELTRTKEIFVHSSPKSLVILDELSEGTTYEEKLESSLNIMQGFRRIGNNTVLITHNHELVERFQAMGVGQYVQLGFDANRPLYKLIEGISRVSHAAQIAERIGFAKRDIERILAAKGL